ncbi:hypothetical protein EJB05_09515, partial [Eragrostis curvula]
MASKLAGERTAKVAAATRAYVTLLAGDDGESFKAVVRLAESLRMVGAEYPLAVAVLPRVPESHRDMLASQGCIVREVEPVYPRGNQCAMASRYVVNCSKLRVWEFVEYERMVYLDAGIHVLENIDELFELEKGHFYAAELDPPYFNSGMFVHEPNVVTATALLDALRVTPPASFLEQDLLSMFFKDQYKPIPLDHNLVQAMLLGHTEDLQLQKSVSLWGEKLPQFGCWLTAKAAVFAPQNLLAMATIAASSAAVGVIHNAANPAICFGFYTVFIAAIATITIKLRGM